MADLNQVLDEGGLVVRGTHKIFLSAASCAMSELRAAMESAFLPGTPAGPLCC